LESGILPPLFDTPPGLSQENTIIHARKTRPPITTESPIAAEQQELAQHEPAAAYPLQDADPQVLVDLQSYKSHEATPEPSLGHKPEANAFIVSKPEPQTFPAFAASSSSLNLNTEPEAVADTSATNGSTTTESSTEHSNSHSHTSSPLTALDDGFSDRENVDLLIPHEAQ
jgi:hypothetical protein